MAARRKRDMGGEHPGACCACPNCRHQVGGTASYEWRAQRAQNVLRDHGLDGLTRRQAS